jgi:hypothetical protein
MNPSRRDFVKGCGALIVSFSAAPLTQSSANAQGPFDTHPGHIDPDKLDSWLAIDADGTITAYTGKCDFAVRAHRARKADRMRHSHHPRPGNHLGQPDYTH